MGNPGHCGVTPGMGKPSKITYDLHGPGLARTGPAQIPVCFKACHSSLRSVRGKSYVSDSYAYGPRTGSLSGWLGRLHSDSTGPLTPHNALLLLWYAEENGNGSTCHKLVPAVRAPSYWSPNTVEMPWVNTSQAERSFFPRKPGTWLEHLYYAARWSKKR